MRKEVQRKFSNPLEFVAETTATLIFLSAAILASERTGGGGEAFATSFMLVFFCLGAIQSIPRIATEEPGSAVLEQLCISQHPLWRLALARDAASAVMFVPTMAVISLGCRLITGIAPAIPPVGAIAPILLMRMGMLGVGYLLGAVALLNKRTGALINLISMGFFALAFAPPTAAQPQGAALAFPYTAWIRPIRSIIDGIPLKSALSPRNALAACVVSCVYIALGVLAFGAAFKRALASGSLSRA